MAYKSGSRAVVIYKHISLYIPCSICDDDDIVTQSLVCSLVIIQHVLLHCHSSVHSLLFNMSCYTVTACDSVDTYSISRFPLSLCSIALITLSLLPLDLFSDLLHVYTKWYEPDEMNLILFPMLYLNRQ